MTQAQRQQARERNRRYYQRHREEILAQQKKRREDPEERAKHYARVERWRKANPEKVLEIGRRSRARNPEAAREKVRRWRDRDREHVNRLARGYYAKDPAAAYATVKRWRDQHPERVREYQVADSLRRRGGKPDALATEYMAILATDPCAYCGGVADTIDHIEPLIDGGSGQWDNLTPACRSCNSAKWKNPLLRYLVGTID